MTELYIQHGQAGDPMLTKPLHVHDCIGCVFLGSLDGADLYVHKAQDVAFTTVIARYGSDGEYSSGLCFVNESNKLPLLTEAARRAYSLNMLSDDDLVYHNAKIM